MTKRAEIDSLANTFIANQSEATYAFRKHDYSGSVLVGERDSLVSGGTIYDIEKAHSLGEWLGSVATTMGIELGGEELWELTDAIEKKLLSPEHTQA